MKKIVTRGLAALCFLMVFSSYSYAERPITILCLEPLSGSQKLYGESQLAGLKFAVEEINAEGGLLGRKVEIIVEDDQFKPEVARRKTEKYLMDKKLDFVMQGHGSHIAKTLLDLTKQHEIVFVNHAMSDSLSGKDFSYNSVQLVYRSAMMARVIVTYLAEKKPYKRFYLLNPDYSYGRDFASMYEKEVRRLIPKSEIVGNDFHPVSTKDLSPFLSKIKSTNAECILSSSYGPDLSILMKQRKELGVTAIVASNPLGDSNMMPELSELAIGCIAADMWLDTVNTPESLDFVKRWKKRYAGTEFPYPTSNIGRTYIAAKVLFDGIKKSKSVELKKLIPVLEGMQLKTLNGDGYLRPCDHQLQQPLPVAEILSKSIPYYGVPTMIPMSKIEIEKSDVDNPRCKQ